MNIDDIYRIMDKFESSSINEFELEMDDVSISLKKGVVSGMPAGMNCMPPMPVAGMPVMPGMNMSVNEETDKEAAEVNEGKVIKAPLVGTFYVAPSEDSDPYVKPGDSVKKGDIIGIIEAMKLMNEIEASEEGIVESIEVNNGNMVEYGQVLIKLK